MDFKQELSFNLKFLLKEKEINRKILADAINVAPSSVSEWIDKEYLPSFANLIKLADYFHTSIDFLFGLTDKRYFFKIKEWDFFNTLESILKSRKIKKTTLSKKCNFGYSQFSRWRKGGFPQIEVLLNIVIFMDISAEYIIGRTDKEKL